MKPNQRHRMKSGFESPKPPTSPTSNPLRVTPTTNPDNPADIEATRALIDLYSDKDGFHCPKCHVTITDPTDAVYHLAEEINQALEQLAKKAVK